MAVAAAAEVVMSSIAVSVVLVFPAVVIEIVDVTLIAESTELYVGLGPCEVVAFVSGSFVPLVTGRSGLSLFG